MAFQEPGLASVRVWERLSGSPMKSNSITGYPKVSASLQGRSRRAPPPCAAKSRSWVVRSLERQSAVTTPLSVNRTHDLLLLFPTVWVMDPKQEMHQTSLSKC